MANNTTGNSTTGGSGDASHDEHFPGPGAVSRRLSFSIQALNLLALVLNAGLLGILARKQSRTGAKGLILLAAAEIGINLSLLLMHTEFWTMHSHPLPVVENFNYSFEACHLLRNAWLSAMTIARALAVSRPFSSTRLLTRGQQAVIFGIEAVVCTAWSLVDLLVSEPYQLRRAMALLRHFLNTVVVGSIIVVTSCVIVHHVRRSSSLQQPAQQHQQHRRRDRQASKIVVTLAVGFFLLEVPNAMAVFIVISSIMIRSDTAFVKSIADALHIIYRVNHLLIVLNTCLNPFVLLAFSSSFRRQVRDAIQCRSTAAGGNGPGAASAAAATMAVRRSATNRKAATAATAVANKNGEMHDDNEENDASLRVMRPLISPTDDDL